LDRRKGHALAQVKYAGLRRRAVLNVHLGRDGRDMPLGAEEHPASPREDARCTRSCSRPGKCRSALLECGRVQPPEITDSDTW
jgi:hypothetical protein